MLGGVRGRGQYRDGASRAIDYVVRTIQLHQEPGIPGGVKGSFPVDGGYTRFQNPNRAEKFFIDAQLLELEADGGDGVRIVHARGVMVTAPRGGQYRVDLKRGTCSCPGGAFRGKCKHVGFARRLSDLLGSSVPEAAGMMKAG